MDVGVAALVVPNQRVDDDARLLRAGRVIQVNERLAVDTLLQDRKVLADLADVERQAWRLAGGPGSLAGCGSYSHGTWPWWSFSSRLSSSARSGSILIRPIMSLAKANVSRLRAACRSMPRARR